MLFRGWLRGFLLVQVNNEHAQQLVTLADPEEWQLVVDRVLKDLCGCLVVKLGQKRHLIALPQAQKASGKDDTFKAIESLFQFIWFVKEVVSDRQSYCLAMHLDERL